MHGWDTKLEILQACIQNQGMLMCLRIYIKPELISYLATSGNACVVKLCKGNWSDEWSFWLTVYWMAGLMFLAKTISCMEDRIQSQPKQRFSPTAPSKSQKVLEIIWSFSPRESPFSSLNSKNMSLWNFLLTLWPSSDSKVASCVWVYRYLSLLVLHDLDKANLLNIGNHYNRSCMQFQNCPSLISWSCSYWLSRLSIYSSGFHQVSVDETNESVCVKCDNWKSYCDPK